MGSYSGQIGGVDKNSSQHGGKGRQDRRLSRADGAAFCEPPGATGIHFMNTDKSKEEDRMTPAYIRRRIGETFMAGCLVVGLFAHSGAQSEQRIDVTIKDFTFVTKQIPLRLDVPTVISIRNVDPERHDFGSSMFDGCKAGSKYYARC